MDGPRRTPPEGQRAAGRRDCHTGLTAQPAVVPFRPRVRVGSEHSQHVQDTVQLELARRPNVAPSLHNDFAAVSRAALHTESHLHDVINGGQRGR